MYTPTRCPTTGRKFTRAERKAANKAKFAKSQAQASKPTKASKRKPKLDPVEQEAVKLAEQAIKEILKRQAERTPKRKGKQASAKATPSTKVADKQDKAFHGRPDTPVTPKQGPVGADVEQARKSAREQGLVNRLEHAMKLATKWAYTGTYGGMYTKEQRAELTRLTGSDNVSTYEDVMVVCM